MIRIFRIRLLDCVFCDETVRTRSEIVDGVEQQARCPGCNTPLISIGSMDLNWPDRGDLPFDTELDRGRYPPFGFGWP